jgi:recombination protein RecR
MLQIAALDRLIHELGKLPGVGPRTAQRLAYHILKSPTEFGESLAFAIQEVQSRIHPCPKCFNFTDLDLCHYCRDAHRSDDILCVVEDPFDISRVESTGVFRGRYHVLHGALSPLEGIGPDDIKIPELVRRIEESAHEGRPVREVILALDADLEGDTTVLYLGKILAELKVKTSRIAHGVPIGSNIEFVDERTMGRALQNRVEI